MIYNCDKPEEICTNINMPYSKNDAIWDKPSEVKYLIKRNYIDVVFTQLPTGIWKDTLLTMLETKTIKELRAAQKLVLSDEVLMTLAGLKILEVYFGGDRKSWKLVASKAKNALKSMLGFTADIDQALT